MTLVSSKSSTGDLSTLLICTAWTAGPHLEPTTCQQWSSYKKERCVEHLQTSSDSLLWYIYISHLTPNGATIEPRPIELANNQLQGKWAETAMVIDWWQWSHIWRLKWTLARAPILQHFNPFKPNVLPTSWSCLANTGNLSCYDIFITHREVNFYTPNCIPIKQNYYINSQKFVAILKLTKEWWQYDTWVDHKVVLRSDYNDSEDFEPSDMFCKTSTY